MEYNKIQVFFANPKISEIIKEYQKAKKKADEDIGFNVFRIISDYYYRENFHGDILGEFLNPVGGHGMKRFFLNHFIDMIRKEKPEGKIGDYDIDETELKREYVIKGKRRIDFLIINEKEQRCIIVENKLYDAIDQENQLPDYYNEISKEYKVDAILYLPLSDYKVPDRSTWEDNVGQLLIIIPAKKLIDTWLKSCIDELETKSEQEAVESFVILKHYSKLLKSLLPNKQKMSAMAQLYNFLKEGNEELLKEAIALKELLNNMPETMSNHVLELIKKDEELNSYLQNGDIISVTWATCGIIVNTFENGSYDLIYIKCNPSEWEGAYRVLLGVNDPGKVEDKGEFISILNKRNDVMEIKDWFNVEPGTQGDNNVLRLVKDFDFNQDEEVVNFIKKVIMHLLLSRKSAE